jgi:hypothetical protein
MPAKSNAAADSPSLSMPVKDLASARRVAAVIQTSLKEGRRVEIERLGEFRPVCGGGFRFVPESRPSVFLAYVSEDASRVERLCEILQTAGFDAWMDRRKLLPGQNWPRAIERAIENADFFVACLSRHAVNKRSCFQGEMRFALDCARRVPFDQVYFVPARLESCSVPLRIEQQLHCVDLFPDFDASAKRLISFIRSEMRRRRAV